MTVFTRWEPLPEYRHPKPRHVFKPCQICGAVEKYDKDGEIIPALHDYEVHGFPPIFTQQEIHP